MVDRETLDRHPEASAGRQEPETEAETQPETETETQTEGLKARGSRVARDVRRDVKQEMEKQVGRGRTRAAEKLDPMTSALRSAAEELDGRGERWMAERARGAAGGLDRMRGYLRDGDAASMMSDLDRQAREHPAVFLGTALAAGVGLGRFLRASPREETTVGGTDA